MPTEESPLLGDPLHPGADPAHALLAEGVYDRFSPQQKRVILAIVSLAGLVPMFVSGCFVPSIPQISNDLDATPAVASLGVSLAVFASSFSSMFWSAYTSYYGRRVIYLCGMPFTILGSFAAAASTDMNSFLFWRVVQTFGCSGGYVLGAASIGDIYKVEERGTAMGTFLAATLFGLALAAPVGGAVAQYWSWRGFQVLLDVWGVIQFLLLAIFFPETAHPGSLGIDKERDSKIFVFVNPFRCLTFHIMAVTLANTFALVTDFGMFRR